MLRLILSIYAFKSFFFVITERIDSSRVELESLPTPQLFFASLAPHQARCFSSCSHSLCFIRPPQTEARRPRDEARVPALSLVCQGHPARRRRTRQQEPFCRRPPGNMNGRARLSLSITPPGTHLYQTRRGRLFVGEERGNNTTRPPSLVKKKHLFELLALFVYSYI